MHFHSCLHYRILGPKGEAPHPALSLNIRKFIEQPCPRRPEVIDFAMAVVMHTFTLAHATKIRTQADHVVMNKGACDGLCHFVFERAPEKRVRVRNDGQALGWPAQGWAVQGHVQHTCRPRNDKALGGGVQILKRSTGRL